MSTQFIIIIFLLLNLIFGGFFVWPKYQELNFLEQRNKEKIIDIQTKEEKLQNLKKTAEELKNYEIQLAKIDSALPPDPDLAALLVFLQKISSQSGLVLVNIKSSVSRTTSNEESKEESNEESKEELKETELSFTVSGDYSSLKNFLSVLEKSARLIEVESISFSSSEKKGSQNFDLKIKVYSY